MKSVILNAEQLVKFVEDKYIEIDKNKIIELYKDSIILNSNGEIHNTVSINIQFQKYEIENKHLIKYLQNLICEHFNLEYHQVVYLRGSGEEVDFSIQFMPNKEWQITVCTYNRALENFRAISDKVIDINIDDLYIGIYRKLCNSCYYFRWFEEI